MSQIVPFKATLPAADLVAHVTVRSYEEYSAAELASQLDFNPFSFLRVLQPGYQNMGTSDPKKRWAQVRARLEEYKRDRILVEEKQPALYLYEIATPTYQCIGFIGGFSVEAYLANQIKKHEDTLAYRVDLFEAYLHTTGFNTEPVLLTYAENPHIESIVTEYKATTPLFHFTTLNKQTHRLWRIDQPQAIAALQNAFAEMGELYIADGHHRCASAAALHQHTNQPYFLGYAVADSQVKIWEYNRAIRDLNQWSVSDFIAAVKERASVSLCADPHWKPTKKGEFGMYIQQKWYAITAKVTDDQPDADWLYQTILLPLLDIRDLRSDARIDYLPGNQGLTPLMQWVDSNEYAVAFSLYPATFQQIKHLADHNEIMPPKSTYIEPKIRSGLVLFEF